jgi:hypothetical protein
MFGDSFVTGSGSLSAVIQRLGVTNNLPGFLNFDPASAIETTASGGSGTDPVVRFTVPPVNEDLPVITITTFLDDDPDILLSSFTADPITDFAFDVEAANTGAPTGTPLPLNAADQQELQIVVNQAALLASISPAIESIEQAADPTATLASLSLTPTAVAEGSVNVFVGFNTSVTVPVTITVPSPATGGAFVGRQKIAENSSPLPKRRLFVNYSHFDNVPLRDGGVNVDRFVPGFETTFFEGRSSIEARFPFAATLDSTITADGHTSASHLEVGNATVGVKHLLFATDSFAVAGGMLVALPWADDVVVRVADQTVLARVNNEAVNLLPYVGGLYAPNDRWFMQGFIQTDIQTDGNSAFLSNGSSLASAGELDDPVQLFVDAAVGYWFLDSPDGAIQSAAATLELHYNRSLGDQDPARLGLFQIGSDAGNVETLNLVAGLTIRTAGNSQFGVGFATPIGNSADHQFDGELRVTWDWYPDGF